MDHFSSSFTRSANGTTNLASSPPIANVTSDRTHVEEHRDSSGSGASRPPSKAGPLSSKKKTAKQHPKQHRRQPSPTTSLTSDTDVMETSEADEPVRRGRGRPESTGAYRIKKAEAAAAEIRKEAAELRNILDPDAPLRPRGKGVAPPEGLEDIRTSAVPTLRGIIKEELRKVEKVASSSGHLKGTFVKALRDAAARIAESTETLVQRAETSVSAERGETAGSPVCETEKLRVELDELRRENVRLRGEVEAQNKRLEEALAARLSAAHLADGPVSGSPKRSARQKIQPSSGSEGDWPPPGPSRAEETAMEVETTAPPPGPPRAEVSKKTRDTAIVPQSLEELTTDRKSVV